MDKRSGNFMSHLSPNMPIQATGLKSVDQAAAEAHCRLNRERPSNSLFDQAEWAQQEKDWNAISKVERRRQRGSATVRKGDLMA